MNVYGYIRVSSVQQNLDIQKKSVIDYCKIRGFDLVGLYKDKATGKNTERPGFTKMMEDLQVNPLGARAIVIHKLDRLGRSLIDLINITKALEEKKIGIISITNSLDTTTSEGRLFFYIMSALSEYERELILERTQLGIKAAKENGVKFGRKPKDVDVEKIKHLISIGVPKRQIAKRMGISRSLLYQKLNTKTNI